MTPNSLIEEFFDKLSTKKSIFFHSYCTPEMRIQLHLAGTCVAFLLLLISHIIMSEKSEPQVHRNLPWTILTQFFRLAVAFNSYRTHAQINRLLLLV